MGFLLLMFENVYRALQLGVVGCVPDEVILWRCDAKEFEVVGARHAGENLLRVIALQHPNIILSQEGIFYINNNKYTNSVRILMIKKAEYKYTNGTNTQHKVNQLKLFYAPTPVSPKCTDRNKACI